MILSENRFPSRIKSGAGFFGILRGVRSGHVDRAEAVQSPVADRGGANAYRAGPRAGRGRSAAVRGRRADPCTPRGCVVHVAATERSAARLAHQSGRLGVGSSNLPAPITKKRLDRLRVPNSPWLSNRFSVSAAMANRRIPLTASICRQTSWYLNSNN